MTSWGEALLFWSVAAIMVLAAIGVLMFRKAAYAALCMVTVMLGMAVLFFTLGAPFNGAVQIIVYTGAIMMLFLFVIMMIGLGATDGFREQRKGYIIFAAVMGIALAAFTVAAVVNSQVSGQGVIKENPFSNEPITSLASTLFQDHWLTIQLSAALLIVAAVGAVVLTHSDRLGVKFNQHNTARARMTEFGTKGHHLGQNPPPGVYAKSNAVDNAAIAGDTLTPVIDSIPRVFRLRGIERPLGMVSREVTESLRLAKDNRRDQTIWSTTTQIHQSQAWGMPGASAPSGLQQIRQEDITTETGEEDAK